MLETHDGEAYNYPGPSGQGLPQEGNGGRCSAIVSLGLSTHYREGRCLLCHTEDGHLVLWNLAKQPEAWEELTSFVTLGPSLCLGSPTYKMVPQQTEMAELLACMALGSITQAEDHRVALPRGGGLNE